MPESLTFRPASPRDAAAVVAVVNGAYRGDASGQGWTHEVGLVGGPRIDEPGFLALLRLGSVVLVAERGGQLVGCVHLEVVEAGECFLGMLSVKVTEQDSGVGRAIMEEAERHARERLGARVMAMQVVTTRHELVAWYERRGYRRTGHVAPFVPRPGITFPRGPLEFERLEKRLDGGRA